ncbi:MAG TPA: hypothetical protein VIK10_11195 [Prolixibacteraceae bacterium]
MKTKGFLLTLTLSFFAFVQLQAAPLDMKALVGKWEYSAPTAPSNYATGQINFTQAGDKLKGELVIEGQKVNFSEITIKEDVVSASIYLESTLITIKFKLVNQSLEGKVEAPDGPIAVKAVRK